MTWDKSRKGWDEMKHDAFLHFPLLALTRYRFLHPHTYCTYPHQNGRVAPALDREIRAVKKKNGKSSGARSDVHTRQILIIVIIVEQD